MTTLSKDHWNIGNVNVYDKSDPVKLSDHFNSYEFNSRSIHDRFTLIDPALIQVMEYFRVLFGKPIFITSGYRPSDYNQQVGGSPRSFHTIGMAADWFVVDTAAEFVYNQIQSELELLKVLGLGGLGYYPDANYFHTDVRGKYGGKFVEWEA